MRKDLKLEDVPRYEELLKAIERAWEDLERGKHRLKDLALVSILIFTGCRLGEVLKLTWNDIDFEAKEVRFNQRVVKVDSELFWNIMKRYRRRFPRRDMRLFDITDRQARNMVYKFSKRYLRVKLRPHAIRHSYAIFILKKTKDLEAVRRLLGHSDYKWLKYYLNYIQEGKEVKGNE